MATIIGLIAVLVAVWQIYEQRQSVELNGKVNSLIQMSNMIHAEIDRHEAIITNLKNNGKDWSHLAKKVNQQLRPLLKETNVELLQALKEQNSRIGTLRMERLLKLDTDSQDSALNKP